MDDQYFFDRNNQHCLSFPNWNKVKDVSDSYAKITDIGDYDFMTMGPTYFLNGGSAELVKFAEFIQALDGINNMSIECKIEKRDKNNLFPISSAVVMKELQFSLIKSKHFIEILKYQPLLHSDLIISCICISKMPKNLYASETSERFKDKLLVVSTDSVWHRRYLHSDYDDMEHHKGIPVHHFNLMRKYYVMSPSSMSAVSFVNKNGIIISVKKTYKGDEENPGLTFEDAESIMKDLKNNRVIHNNGILSGWGAFL